MPSDVIAEGQAIAKIGIRYLVQGLIPNYGVLGMLIAYAKVGKTTFGQALSASVGMGHAFLDFEHDGGAGARHRRGRPQGIHRLYRPSSAGRSPRDDVLSAQPHPQPARARGASSGRCARASTGSCSPRPGRRSSADWCSDENGQRRHGARGRGRQGRGAGVGRAVVV